VSVNCLIGPALPQLGIEGRLRNGYPASCQGHSVSCFVLPMVEHGCGATRIGRKAYAQS